MMHDHGRVGDKLQHTNRSIHTPQKGGGSYCESGYRAVCCLCLVHMCSCFRCFCHLQSASACNSVDEGHITLQGQQACKQPITCAWQIAVFLSCLRLFVPTAKVVWTYQDCHAEPEIEDLGGLRRYLEWSLAVGSLSTIRTPHQMIASWDSCMIR